jgi:ergothioneine biosynthesis protein EgtB
MVRVSDSLLPQVRYVRQATLALAAPLSAEDQMLQSMPDASPVKWHLAHTTWFFETFILREHVPGYRPLHDDFRRVFNSYYKQVGDHPNRARRGLFSRPTLEQVLAYRQHVDEHLDRLLASAPDAQWRELVLVGINHEQQHQELILTDIKHALWSQPLQPAYQLQSQQSTHRCSSAAQWIEYSGGIHPIGFSGESFCFDNETPRHDVLLQPFRLQSRLTTNAEYLQFMQDGGYHNPTLWLSEGWDTVLRESWQAPLYWEQRDGQWHQFTLAGWQPIDLDAPVGHVSYFEADAYARWAGARLPLESEWEVAATPLTPDGNFVESGELRPVAETASVEGMPHQMFGDVWEWTASPYTPYPGYKPAEGALGEYNGKFMCNQYVLRGGSCATPQSHIRASYRNFFPAHVRWQFTGIRLAADAG